MIRGDPPPKKRASEFVKRPNSRNRATTVATIALAALVGGCQLIQHIATPKIPPGLNLTFNARHTWRRVPPIDLSGRWIDPTGGRVLVREQGGFGEATVETEDSRFFWTDGTFQVLNGAVTLTRRLAGQEVDGLEGRLTCHAVGGDCAISIDFGDGGIWTREQAPVPLSGDWYVDQKQVTVTHLEGNEFSVTGDPSLGWTKGRGTIDRDQAQFLVELVNGGRMQIKAQLGVGLAWTTADIQAAHEEAQRAASAGG